ncbi:DNA cytosine methyltransferase [Flavobacterium psychrophilum]|nr:DNA cytosine methyltransferase [Flavobacterium psychrophilum]
MKGISMFSSGGIAETYLNEIGIDILLANELVEERANFYKHLYPKSKMITGDILNKDIFTEFLKEAKKIKPSFLIATPPCQGMSSLGKKDYEIDERNLLIFSVIEIIKGIDFDFILIENVPKFFKLFFPFKGEMIGIIEILEKLFSDTYIIEHYILNAKDYGVPQSRPRAIIKLYKKNKNWGMPATKTEITLKEAIGHLPSLMPEEKSKIKFHYAMKHSLMQVEAMTHTPEGKSAMVNEIYYPKKANGEKVSGFHNTYKRMKWDSPAPARATNNGLISGHNNVHPGRQRKDGTWSDPRVLSLLELFIVSSLPEDWNIPTDCKESLVRLLIGEAIPPLMLKEVLSKINQ